MAQARVVADNDQVRVTTWSFDPGTDSTGRHIHEYDYVVVPITGGNFSVTNPDGSTRQMTQVAGSPYLGVALTEHDVANGSDQPVVFVEIELKRQ